MLRGYRCILAAIAGLILASANHANAETGNKEDNAQGSVAKSLENIAARYDDAAKRAEHAEKEDGPCGPEQYGSNADLCAQWKAADAAANSAWWAWASGVVGFGSLVGVIIALGLTMRANSIARETARKQLRAYITVSPMGIAQLIQNTDANGQVLLRNVGHLPARGVVLHVKMKTAPKTEASFPVDADELIERAVQAGGELRQGSKDYIAAQQIANCGEHIFVWGIAYYDDGYGERRFTRFCHRYDSASRNRGIVWNRKINKTRLILDPDKARFHVVGNDAT